MSTFFVYTITLILAACSILYELVIAQTLSNLTSNIVVWYSLTIGLYLGGMGIGAFFSRKLKSENVIKNLFNTEVLLSLVGAFSVVVIYFSHMLNLYFSTYGQATFAFLIFLIPSVGVILLLGFLTGVELPLLILLNQQISAKKNINRILGIDYFGSLLGAIIFPLFLVPHFSVISVGFYVAVLNACVAFVLLYYVSKKRSFIVITGLTLFLPLFFMITHSQYIHQYFLKKYYFYKQSSASLATLFSRPDSLPLIENYHTPYQEIDIVRYPFAQFTNLFLDIFSSKLKENPDFPFNYMLFLNGDYQFSSNTEEFYHEYFAHIPILMRASVPRKVLVVGAGDGLLDRELLKYPQIQTITHVEIDEQIIKLARHHPVLMRMNEGALDDPRVNVVIDDAFRYIRNTDDIFDAVYLDLPDPNNYNLSKVYSTEFYHQIFKHLTSDGFVVMDAPNIQNKAKNFKGNWPIYFNTLRQAGFKFVLPYLSSLEHDNQQAIYTLKQNDYYNPYDILKTYVESFAHGFIIAKKVPVNSLKFNDYGIKMHALNESRFYKSFELSDKLFLPIEDISVVNSVVRPTLPNLSIWHTKKPYYFIQW